MDDIGVLIEETEEIAFILFLKSFKILIRKTCLPVVGAEDGTQLAYQYCRSGPVPASKEAM
jgi:hypothetical protein